ncbi:hypothetical protein LY76DRAFT_237503 [Colletotrichum caudatum]|nr:hypothetical protein LY76DRAFT_237503 [Colletotrichum caudatum]
MDMPMTLEPGRPGAAPDKEEPVLSRVVVVCLPWASCSPVLALRCVASPRLASPMPMVFSAWSFGLMMNWRSDVQHRTTQPAQPSAACSVRPAKPPRTGAVTSEVRCGAVRYGGQTYGQTAPRAAQVSGLLGAVWLHQSCHEPRLPCKPGACLFAALLASGVPAAHFPPGGSITRSIPVLGCCSFGLWGQPQDVVIVVVVLWLSHRWLRLKLELGLLFILAMVYLSVASRGPRTGSASTASVPDMTTGLYMREGGD